LLKLSLYL